MSKSFFHDSFKQAESKESKENGEDYSSTFLGYRRRVNSQPRTEGSSSVSFKRSTVKGELH